MTAANLSARPGLVTLLVDVSHDISGDASDSGYTMVHPPVPLLSLASYLRACFSPEELSVQVLDLAALPGGFRGLRRALEQLQPDLVGVRSLSHTHAQFHRAAALVKELDAGVVVAGGGMYPNTSPDRAMADPNVDAICLAEGELVLRDMTRALLGGRGVSGLSRVKGIWYRAGGRVQKNPAMPAVEDLDLPPADYGEIDLSVYAGRHAATCVLRPYGVIMTSRGCPYRCIFCHNLFGNRMRYRSADDVAAELLQLNQRHGIRDFLICDNIFNVDLKRAKEVLRRIAALGIEPRLYFPQGLRGDSWDPEFLDLLAAAGTVELVYAIESASARILGLMRKELDLPRVIEAIHQTAQRGIMVNAFYMFGFPGETVGEMDQTADLVGELMDTVHFPFVQIVRAWDRGPLHDLARQEGFDSEFLTEHSMLPLGFQEAIRSEHNFAPAAELKKVRLRIAMMFASSARLQKLLPLQRELFTEEELVLKYATYFGATRQSARTFLARAGAQSTEQRGP